MTVSCPTCKQEREVGANMAWRIRTGKNKNCKGCSLKGNTHGSGVVHTEEFKAMKRQQMIGNSWAVGAQYADEERQRRSEVMLGNKYREGFTKEKVWNWKGGVTSANRLERVKFQRTMQKNIFERDDYRCQICDVRGGYLSVDHIERWSDRPELRFEPSNCRTLCQSCHYEVTFGKPIPNNSLAWGHNLSLAGKESNAGN